MTLLLAAALIIGIPAALIVGFVWGARTADTLLTAARFEAHQ